MPLVLALALIVLSFIAGGMVSAWFLALVAMARNTAQEQK